MTETAMAKNETAPAQGRFATFFVSDLYFGVDVLRVQEVLRCQPMTRVPRAPGVIEGLINLRGQIVTAIDMRRRLRLEARADALPPMNIVIRTEDGAVSLLVDSIGDVIEVEGDVFERPPQNLDDCARDLVRGVCKLKDRLLLVIDTERAVEVGLPGEA